MKKIFLITAVAAAVSAVSVSASSQVEIYINGEKLNTQYEPVIENDTTLVPMRDIFEALGAKIEWIESEKAVMAYDGVNVLKLTVGADTMLLNNNEVELNLPAKIINDKTYVPLRAVSESLNADVVWEEETRSVKIERSSSEHIISRLYREENIKDEDGNVIINAYVAYPKIDNTQNNEGISALNDYYEEYSQDMLSEIKDTYSEAAKEIRSAAEENGVEFSPVFMYFGYETAYDKYNKISFVEQLTAHYMGNIETVYFDTYNYDFDKNDVMEISDILNVTENDFNILSVYSFYLYDDSIICCLSSDNMIYYNYGYEPSMGLQYNDITKDAFKFNPITGEISEGAEPVALFETQQPDSNEEIQESIEEFKSVDAMSNVMGFKMIETSSPERYIPVAYQYINESVGQAIYEDINKNKVVLRKAEGDFNVTERDSTTPIKEKVIENSCVQFFDDGEACYACFAIEKGEKVYSYSVELESRDMAELEVLCKNIIKSENI